MKYILSFLFLLPVLSFAHNHDKLSCACNAECKEKCQKEKSSDCKCEKDKCSKEAKCSENCHKSDK